MEREMSPRWSDTAKVHALCNIGACPVANSPLRRGGQRSPGAHEIHS